MEKHSFEFPVGFVKYLLIWFPASWEKINELCTSSRVLHILSLVQFYVYTVGMHQSLPSERKGNGLTDPDSNHQI